MSFKRSALTALVGLLASAPAFAAEPLVFISKFGSHGNAAGQFLGPYGIATDAAGNVYVTDFGKNVIDKFTGSGQFVSAFGGTGNGNGHFNGVRDVAVDINGVIYVSDPSNSLIQVFSSNGTFLRQWPALGSFALALDPTGSLLATAGGDSAAVYRTVDGVRVARFAFSSFFNTFDGSLGIGSSGTLYIAPGQENVIRQYSLDGTFLGAWGTTGSGPGQFISSLGLTVDASDDVFVFDGGQGVEQFNSSGLFLSQFGGLGAADGQFQGYVDMAADPFGNLFVLDPVLYRVTKFGPISTPTRRTTWGGLKARYR